MSWVDLRRRSQDPESALLNDLINQKIQAEAQDNVVDDIENFIPISEVASKTIKDDSIFYAAIKSNTVALDSYIPREPDGNYLRCWFKNDHGGNYLTDYSKMDNIIQLHADPLSPDNPDYSNSIPKEPTMILIGSQDHNVTPNQTCNYFTKRNNHYLRILDNPNVRIKEIAATATGFTVFCRIWVSSTNNEANTGRRSVLFSKLDTEQIDYAYEAQLADDGSLFWFVRKNYAEYSLKSSANTLTFIDELDYAGEDYDVIDYQANIETPPNPIPFTDLAFTFNFSTKQMQIIKDGTVIADSTSQGYATNLVASYGLNEGGNMASAARTVYDGANTNNGTITNATWTTDHYLRFDPTDATATDYVTIPQNATINSYSGNITISMWIYPIALPAGGATHEFITKNGTAAGSFRLTFNGTNTQISAAITTDLSVTQAATVNSSFATLNQWYHVVMSWASGSKVSIYVNNVKTQSASTLTGTLSTGATSLFLGSSTSGKTPNARIDDVAIWTRTLSDAEVTNLFNQGHPVSSFPVYQDDPPAPGGAPGPITNPFVQVYGVALPTTNDFIKLHLKGLTNLSQFYSIADGAIHHGQGTFTNPTTVVYNVADSTSGGVGTALYDLAGTNHHTQLDGNSITRIGELIQTGSTLIGKVLSRIIVRLRTASTGPTGNVTVGIRKADNTFIQFGSTLAANSMPDDGTDRDYTFDLLTNNYALAVGDWISVEGTNMGSSNYVDVKKHQAGGVANTVLQDYNGSSWSTESSGYQLAGTFYENTGTSGYFDIYATSPAGHAYTSIYVNAVGSSLVGKKITKATFTVKKTGSPTTGNLVCSIIKAAGGIITLGTGIGVSTITATDMSVSFTDRTQSYALANGDHIALSCSTGNTTSTACISVKRQQTDTFTGANEQTGTTTPTWTNVAADDLIGQLETGGDTVNDPDIPPQVDLNDTRKRFQIYAGTGSALIGKVITQVSARLFSTGTPTGNVSVVIRNASDAVVASFGSIDSAVDITSTVASKNFTNTSNTVAMAANYAVSIEYAGGTSTDYISAIVQLNIDTPDSYDTTKTFVRTYNGSTYTNTTYDFSGGMYTGGGPSDPSGRTRGFEYVATDVSALRGKKITKAGFYLQKVGTITTGTISVNLRKASDDGIGGTVGTIDPTTVSTTAATYYEVSNTAQQYALGIGDKVSVEFAGGDDTNYIKLFFTTIDSYDGTVNTFAGNYDSPTYYSTTTEDICGNMWTGGDTFTPAADEIPPPRSMYYTHDLMVLAGGDDWGLTTDPRNFLASAIILPEFRFERQILTTTMLTNLKNNGCSTTAIAAGKVAKVGYFALSP